MHNRTNNIIALDPGTREMGYACFEETELVDYGVKSIRPNRTTRDLFVLVDRIVTRMVREKRPIAVVIEKNTFSQISQNIRLTLVVSRIKAISQRYRVRVFEFDPRTIRKVVCNNGNATKRELARTVAVRFPEMRAYLESNRRWRERYYQNAFDAIACGLTFVLMNQTFVGRETADEKKGKEA